MSFDVASWPAQAGGRVRVVALVDGNNEETRAAVAALTVFYRVKAYPDAGAAIFGFARNPPQMVLVDEGIAPLGGLKFVKTLRLNPDFSEVPVILITRSKDKDVLQAARESGADGCVRKPLRPNLLVKVVTSAFNRKVERRWHFLPPTQRTALRKTLDVFLGVSQHVAATGESTLAIPYMDVYRACLPIIEMIRDHNFQAMLDSVKEHDNYSYVHSLRVATLLSLLGHAIGLSEGEIASLATGGLLHDVGKTAVPLTVLNKPGRLMADEWDLMKGHVAASVRYLEANGDVPPSVIAVAGQHHEKLDGSGYPNGLAGDQLNELARMAAIADVFSALTDRRVYKPSMSVEHALATMKEQMRGHLDQHLLSLFSEVLLDSARKVAPPASSVCAA